MDVIDYRERAGSNPDKMFKATFFESRNLLLGLNCLEPGQSDRVHVHQDQDKFYYVVEGEAEFTVGGDTQLVGAGSTVLAPAGVEHGVRNAGTQRAVILMGLSPWNQ
ncbi:MAG: hypothetical protein QOF51_1629 [Chloroflexota bacterium]|nr:hypothetical protein [Chloroflexota bacterium]